MPKTHIVQSEVDIIDALQFRHTAVETILQSRLSHLSLSREVWTDTNARGSIDYILASQDHGALVDLLRILNLKPKLLTLEIAGVLLPALCELLFEIFEE